MRLRRRTRCFEGAFERSWQFPSLGGGVSSLFTKFGNGMAVRGKRRGERGGGWGVNRLYVASDNLSVVAATGLLPFAKVLGLGEGRGVALSRDVNVSHTSEGAKRFKRLNLCVPQSRHEKKGLSKFIKVQKEICLEALRLQQTL